MNILIVEDDNDINKLLNEIMNSDGYTTKSAYSGTEALIYLEMQNFDVVLLDLMIPGLSGEELLLKIRQNKNMPVIIISAKDDKHTKIDMLKNGADDFISKPFDVDEVLARVESNLRRYSSEKNIYCKTNEIIFREINLNIDTREITINGKDICLTSREFDILQLLIHNPKKVFTKSNIFESVWEEDYMGDDNTINVHISNLRNKISKYAENEYIQTIWGIGYKLEV
ncbi:response regulator transcription factor [Romboutsia lituseburensis]|uniref:Stage 0 sporulation protein A homolog n=1 Tax=Romboutsia lituseburensis DSM 797 TaxID=1121325 RepID=A0A1G9UR17_9FIRM|nr:response regulator transcription factor [Romboutsia lituseburensis]CEH36152.1 Sensory transduction protein regX3 [Romboutsia lituseburensis]SDM62411.1 DNA-binding response regulator, OmpR family, contains REC and winged-helix (wHTH) domain [Romboutsia lituseburensis DSM 797]